MENEYFVLLVKHLLIDARWTQEDLADAIGHHVTTVSKWIKSGSLPYQRQLEILQILSKNVKNGEDLQPIIEAIKDIERIAAKVNATSRNIYKKRRRAFLKDAANDYKDNYEERAEGLARMIEKAEAVNNYIDDKYDQYEKTADADNWLSEITRTHYIGG